MGASGKALRGHGARRKTTSPAAQPKDGGYGPPPHPLTARPGQRFFPLTAARRRALQLIRIDPGAGRAIVKRLDYTRDRVTATVARLLAVDEHGQPRFYAFCGYAPRRYGTLAAVIGVNERAATLVLPEWHPARPVTVPSRQLPAGAGPGVWLACSADLSQPTPARLNLGDLELTAALGMERVHRPTLQARATTAEPERPAVGEGCGDIVLEHTSAHNAPLRGGLLDIYVTERPAATRPDDRLFLADNGQITRYLRIARVDPTPMGALVRCRPASHTLPTPINATVGDRTRRGWRWRWWPDHPLVEETRR
jgi:hypothetical protein